MRFSLTLIKDLSIPILTTAIGGFVGSWLLFQYQQPQIVYYTDGYYSRLNDLSIGSIFIVNEGRSSEANLSISIDDTIATSDIAVGYLSTPATISNEATKTRITIPKLKPHEYAEIVFRSRKGNGNFAVGDLTSESGNIRHEEWIRSWWNFTKLQLGILVLVATGTFAVGFSAGLIKNDLFTKKQRK